MTDALFSSTELASDPRAGYRLQRLEVFNWGTFDGRVWRLDLDGETSLLTGDIGSGKSTLVDAVTTLLLPAHRIAYNKAAGADTRERTLRSYVEGHYKSERVESTGVSRAIGLREDHRTYSVILGVFTNEGYGEEVTLAQVFHQRDRQGQPDRFFVTAPQRLSIEEDLTGFGADLNELRRRLRGNGSTVSTTFPDYGRLARRMLGIRSEQAMDLFHQTVSMKSVGNLNEFVRNHMLEPVDASEKVAAIVAHFDDLTKAHDAVRRAKEQLEALDPLVELADRYDRTQQRQTDLTKQRDAVEFYFGEKRIDLLTHDIETWERGRDEQQRQVPADERKLEALAANRERLIAERASAGGDRIAELEREERDAAQAATERRERREQYADSVGQAELEPVEDETGFNRLGGQVPGLLEELRAQRTAGHQELAEHAATQHNVRGERDRIQAELASLQHRRSNLPSSHLDLRSQLCDALSLDADELPFAGELIDVADNHDKWRGAAERVLRGFGLSLLVPQEHYRRVAHWVNDRQLSYRRDDGKTRGLRLVYERVPERLVPLRRPAAGGTLLADVLEVAETDFTAYLRDQLMRRADHHLATDAGELQAHQRAVTAQGQVRSGDRHEKDDRSRIDDPRNWVLGWANERKIAALAKQLTGHDEALARIAAELESLSERREALDGRISALDALRTYRSWNELDWREAKARAEAAAGERERLLAGSSRLAEIEQSLGNNAAERRAVSGQLEQRKSRLSVLQDRIERASRSRQQVQDQLAALSPQQREVARTAYPAISKLAGAEPSSAEELDQASSRVTSELHRLIDKAGKELGGYSQSLVAAMSEVRRRWPEATTEMDANVAAREEYRSFRDRVAGDDLPKFEDEFKRQLNTNTIRELAGFSNWLRRQSDEIGARVARINEALGAIDYSPGRYISLVSERTINQEIQQFRQDLRVATDDVLASDDDRYSERRFLDVQRIIERFRGREGHTDSDKAWTRRVTDVRNWFTFSASERDRDSDEEWEHYRDSDGKSGGQKEKLAYTILAASLAYQFGLEWGVQRSRDFRFAVIDEAFGRGSDVSTRCALDLFAKLGLQLLIVTPLQKVHIIEPYVRSIGFVDNPTGSCSRLQSLTIEELRARRAGAAAASMTAESASAAGAPR